MIKDREYIEILDLIFRTSHVDLTLKKEREFLKRFKRDLAFTILIVIMNLRLIKFKKQF